MPGRIRKLIDNLKRRPRIEPLKSNHRDQVPEKLTIRKHPSRIKLHRKFDSAELTRIYNTSLEFTFDYESIYPEPPENFSNPRLFMMGYFHLAPESKTNPVEVARWLYLAGFTEGICQTRLKDVITKRILYEEEIPKDTLIKSIRLLANEKNLKIIIGSKIPLPMPPSNISVAVDIIKEA